ncbi:hypothetical protein [Cohnella sp. AR92]|uniref:hypothetical protein n=1 Tax=Cohnella sp. AR92 TaxID=648716 RepID=UPI000F8F3ACB|nr:hypothetical protein [Cohnella sp. AR92]RUS42278.1 hypothetical protein ELR57_27075 [Cohnella sp. AR92]
MAKSKLPIESTALQNTVDEREKAGVNYLRSRGFLEKWPEYERFKAGDQWPPQTERTKHLPRPVFNIIRYIQNHKVSSVMNENIKMIFTPEEAPDIQTSPSAGTMPNPYLPQAEQEADLSSVAADMFTRYSDTVWEEVKQDELNEEALEGAANIGTGIWHYYWDLSKKGGTVKPYIGAIRGEVLDPINVHFGNPQQRDVQKQPYIVITSREQLDQVRKEAEANGLSKDMAALITADKDTQDEGYDAAKVEIDVTKKVTVKTMYWKQDGSVRFCRVASKQLVKAETSTGFELYPIAVMQWERRKKSIHGIGDTEGLIPNQKGINFLMAMQLLSVQLTGWPKMIVNPNFVDPNSINNDPSLPILNNSGDPNAKGVEYLTPGPVSNLAQGLVESFMDYTKSLSSAQDASTGDMSSGNLNATAIMLLQKAAGVPIESIKKRFYRAMEDVGRIWEQFWKVKYNTTRRVNLKDDEDQSYSEEFRGTDYADVNLNLKIDIGPSSTYSEQLMMTSLDKLYDKQAIDTEQYLEFAPKTVVPFKDRLLKQLRAKAEAAAQNPQPNPMEIEQARSQQQMALKQQDHATEIRKEEIRAGAKVAEAQIKHQAAVPEGAIK